MKRSIILTAICLSTVALVYTSCKKSETKTNNTTTPTLYERVGGSTLMADTKNSGVMIEKGRYTLRCVVDSSINVIAADTQLQKYFKVLFMELGASNTSGLTALSKNLTDFFCTATGCTNSSYAYVGKTMAAAHNPASNNRMALKANAADFDKFVGDVGAGLAQNGVTSANNKQLVDDLVALLYTLKNDIVQR